jgi:glycosyltransferase involved in cell wall biosynthesis
MASNVPVVASERVLAGIADGGFRSGRDLLAASSDEEYARAVATLLADERERERLAGSARQRLLATYRWAPNLDLFEDLVGAAARPPAGASLLPAGGEREEGAAALAAAAGEARRA